MNPSIAVPILLWSGFGVAALILLWAGFEIVRRVVRRRGSSSRAVSTWVPLQSSVDFRRESDHSRDEDVELHEARAKAQQNGHYSSSKRRR